MKEGIYLKFIEKVKDKKMTLVFSSPKNDINLLKAAWESGADAVKIHLNVHHHASNNNFKTFEEEKDSIRQILELSPVPVGVVIGGDPQLVLDDLENVENSGFDFCSLYLHDTPSEVYYQSKLTIMSACNYTYSLEEIRNFSGLGAQILEASVVDPNLYGELLNMKDILKYKMIKETIDIPLLVPSQKLIRPSDIQLMKKVGVDALMLGAVVTKDSIDSVSKSLTEFRNEIDKIEK